MILRGVAAGKYEKRRPGCPLNALCTFNLHPVSSAMILVSANFQR